MKATAQGFKACLVHPDFGNEVVEGMIFIHRSGFRFDSEKVSEEIPVSTLFVELSDDGEIIYFKDYKRPDLSIYTRDQRVFSIPSLPQLAGLRAEMRQDLGRREVSRSVRLTVYFVIGFACVAWLFSWATGAAVRSLALRASPEWEREFGQSTLKMLESDDATARYSNQVLELGALAEPLLKVVPQSGNPVSFYIVNDPDPNAFALPGGFVVVNSGLLEMTDRPEELLGVLAHELAHVARKHYAQKMISASGSFAIFGVFLGGREGLSRVLVSGSGHMITQGFSRAYETEADDDGWNYLVAANIDPRGMISVFRKLQVFEASEKTGVRLPESFQSHPALEKRIARLEAKWNRLSAKASFPTMTNQLPRVEKN